MFALFETHPAPVVQTAIANPRAPHRQQLVFCRQADQDRKLYQPPCSRWWQVDWKRNKPARVAIAYWAARIRLDNVVLLCSSLEPKPAMRARHRIRVE